MDDRNKEIVEILHAGISADNAARNKAEKLIIEMQKNPEVYLRAMSGVLADESVNLHVRRLAGLNLKNYLSSRNDIELEVKATCWVNLSSDSRNWIKNSLMSVLNSKHHDTRHTAAMAVATVARIEVPRDLWPDLFVILINGVNTGSAGIKLAALETIGFVCDALGCGHGYLTKEEINAILTKIIENMAVDNAYDLQEAALKAMLNIIDFAVDNFDCENDRRMIIMSCCTSASLGPTPIIRQTGYECLVLIVALHYSLLQPFIQTLFDISIKTIKTEASESVVLQALEFWSSLCDAEKEMEEMITEYLGESNQEGCDETTYLPPELVNYKYVNQSLPHLIPLLLEAMTKQEEDQSDGTWNVPTAATVCLLLVAENVGSEVLQYTMPFVTSNIGDPDWRKRDAAVMAFGHILHVPEKTSIISTVLESLGVLLSLLKSDPSSNVRSSAAWAIAKITLDFMDSIPVTHWGFLIESLVEQLSAESSIAAKVCYAIHNIAQNVRDSGSLVSTNRTTNNLSQYSEYLIHNLLLSANRPDSDENKLDVCAFEAINMIIESSADDKIELLLKLLEEMLKRLNNSLMLFSATRNPDQLKLQGLLYSPLQYLCIRLESRIDPYVDEIMPLCLQAMIVNPSCYDTLFIVVGTVAQRMDRGFKPYLSSVLPHVYKCLENIDAEEVCFAGIGICADIIGAVGGEILMYCDELISHLLKLLAHHYASRRLKPTVISVFQDITLAIGGEFEKYLGQLMPMIIRASSIQLHDDEDDEDYLDYVNTLHESILEAFSGVLHGFYDAQKLDKLEIYLNYIFEFLRQLAINKAYREDSVLKHATAMIGDLASAYGASISGHLKADYINHLINDGKNSGAHKTRKMATWAAKEVTQCLQSSV